MIVIFGLGNPGKEYVNNRHNVGFLTMGKLAEAERLVLKDDKYIPAEIAKSSDFTIVAPLTFINNSGQAVTKLLKDSKISEQDIWVVHDDTELPFGQIRVKFGGTSAGHNGIKSIDDAIGPNYWRIRIGVGRPENPNIDLADYVLSDFTQEEEKMLPEIIDSVVTLLVQSLKDKRLETITINAKKD